MPFPSALTSPQKTTLRSSGYWSRVMACLCPSEIVFHALSSQAITNTPFITFTYNTVTVGSFSAVWEGMVVYLSPTSDIRDAIYRGRVRLAPTSGVFYISENASILTVGMHILVVRDTDVFSRIRRDTLVDGSIVYRDLAPTTKNLPFTTVLYDSANAGTVTFTPSQTGIPVDLAATTISTWAWSVSGTGTNSISNAALQHPTFTFQAGYHYLVRVVYTDNNAQSNYQIIHVYVVTRTFSSPVVKPILTGSISSTLEDGWTASLTAYADVTTLVDRTHCAIFHVEHFGDNSSTPIVSNVLMNGRIRSDTITTEGSAEAGQLQQVTFTVEGITAYLRRLRIPSDIIRATTVPNEWGEIKEPNPFRMAMYALWTYTTLTNLGSLGVEDGAFSAWRIGGEPRSIEGGYALDVLISILEPIKAYPNFAPEGDIFLARTVSYLAVRSGVVTVSTFELKDMRDVDIVRDSSQTVSQVIGYGGAFGSGVNTFVLYTAQSPSIVYLEGETRELTREILTVNSTATAAAAELAVRTGNHFAYSNSKPVMSMTLFDSYAGVLRPTNFQRWNALLAASSNTLGMAYGAADFWQLQSVSLAITGDGSIDVTVSMPAETEFSDAQELAALLPINLSNMNPVLPVLPNDPANPTDPLELYPTDTPALEDLQAIDPYSAAQSMTPFTPDVAAQITAKQGNAGCKTLAINFKNSTNTLSAWTTLLAANYLFSLSGSAKISSGTTIATTYNFLTGTQSWVEALSGYANWVISEGWLIGGTNARIWIALVVPTTIKEVRMFFNGAIAAGGKVELYATTGGGTHDISGSSPVVSGLTITGGVSINLYASSLGNTLPAGFRLTRVDLVVETVVPTPLFGDAFYQWEKNEGDEEINVQLLAGSQGLYLDNTKYTPVPTAPFPPYKASHLYEGLPFTGTNNPLNARMQFDSYTDVASTYLNLEMCRKV